MNTAVRSVGIQRKSLVTRAAAPFVFKKRLHIIILVLVVLLAAVSLVYTKDLNRRMFIHYQQEMNQRQQSYVQWGKLLLEQGTLSTQGRVQQLASQRLGMVYPQPRDIVLVKLPRDGADAAVTQQNDRMLMTKTLPRPNLSFAASNNTAL